MKVRSFFSLVVALSLALVVHPALAASPSLTTQTEEPFAFVAEWALYDPLTGEVEFTLVFNQPPDFFTVDEFGRTTNSFQYYIVGDESLHWPERFDSIIRGDEIRYAPGTLRLRNPVPGISDPEASGWGSLRGTVSYQLNGTVLTFSVPLDLLSDHSVDGNFTYELLTTVYGAMTKQTVSQSFVLDTSVQIDIKPRTAANKINPGSGGFLPVAILTTPDFDATTVDPASVVFIPNKAHEAKQAQQVDIDHDGDTDLVLYFRIRDTGLSCSTESALIAGQTFDSQSIFGVDSIQTVGCQ